RAPALLVATLGLERRTQIAGQRQPAARRRQQDRAPPVARRRQLDETRRQERQRLALFAAERLADRLGALVDARLGGDRDRRRPRRLRHAAERGKEQLELVVVEVLERRQPIARHHQLLAEAVAL